MHCRYTAGTLHAHCTHAAYTLHTGLALHMRCTCRPRLCAVATVHDVLVAHVAARVRRKVRVLTEKAEQHRRATRREVATARLRQREQCVARVAVCREDGVESAWSMRAWNVRGVCVLGCRAE